MQVISFVTQKGGAAKARPPPLLPSPPFRKAAACSCSNSTAKEP
jgi:hypothetical protein